MLGKHGAIFPALKTSLTLKKSAPLMVFYVWSGSHVLPHNRNSEGSTSLDQGISIVECTSISQDDYKVTSDRILTDQPCICESHWLKHLYTVQLHFVCVYVSLYECGVCICMYGFWHVCGWMYVQV